MIDGYSYAVFSPEQSRIVELALKQYQGTLDECLEDEGLTDEERWAFKEDLMVLNEMIQNRVWNE